MAIKTSALIRLLLIFYLIMMISCASISPTKFYTYQSPSISAMKSYTIKPVYKGKKEKAIYISGSYSLGEQKQDVNEVDTKKAGAISINQSVTDKHYNYHYGIGASYGKYKFGNSINDFITAEEEKEFYTINLKTGINFNQSTKKVDFRVFGIEIIYNYQNGAYLDKIASIPVGNIYSGDYHITVRNPKSIFSYNINTELVSKFSETRRLGVGLFYGKTIDANHSFDYSGATIFYTHHKLTVSLVIEELNKDIYNSTITNSKIGLSYELFRK